MAAGAAAASYPAAQTAEMEIGGDGSGGREPRGRGRGPRRHGGGRSQSEKAGRGEMGEEPQEEGAASGGGCLGAGARSPGGFPEAQ